MADTMAFEGCSIKNAKIFSNIDDLEIDLISSADVEYSESMFTDTIEVDYVVSNISGGVRGKTLM